ncbi:tryptophan halogenase family protein [Glaciecola sp. 1036]|uniref:tryptophan halogenase family protein n=1 Tax=Alteromonadaceae TaxID=72275 RepID=UPI003CFE3E33
MKQQHVVILGAGTAGWMTAAALSRFLPQHAFKITLIASTDIGTVGVGEATIPHIRHFNQLLGIDENTFMQAVGATYKLAIRFKDWGYKGADYCHGFGYSGQPINDIEFHQYYLYAKQHAGLDEKDFFEDFDKFNPAALAAKQHRFAYPVADSKSPLSQYGYAFHLDASQYADYLRKYSVDRGVEHLDAKVDDVILADSGDIEALTLSDGRKISGDLFVDCSGFRGRLIAQVLEVGYENWQHWLPCDSAQAVPSDPIQNPPSYTLSQAHEAGWRWQIPLQHRTGNGIVYAKSHMSDDQATSLLLSALGDQALANPSQIRFITGKREKSWAKNCVAIGLSSGFLEPLESTSLYLIQVAIEKLIEYFPVSGQSKVLRDNFNKVIDTEYERIRDFLIFHYHQNSRPEAFWQACAQMEIPLSLQQRIEQFTQNGHFQAYRQGLFMPVSWTALSLGQGLEPVHIDPRLVKIDAKAVSSQLIHYQRHMATLIEKLPSHSSAIQASKSGAAHYPPTSLSLYGAYQL